MTTELNCKNCGERPSCWYGQNKAPKKCDSYWNASGIGAVDEKDQFDEVINERSSSKSIFG